MQNKLTQMNAELAKATTRHKISARGHALCEQRAASAESAISRFTFFQTLLFFNSLRFLLNSGIFIVLCIRSKNSSFQRSSV